MERAGKIIGKLRLKVVNIAGVKSYHLAPKAWSVAVGKTISAHSRAVFLDGDRLIVEAEDAIWMAQLQSLEGAILERIGKVVNAGMIRRLEFRVASPRRGPQPAAPGLRQGIAGGGEAEQDEADAIEDPVMRRVFRSARRKATA